MTKPRNKTTTSTTTLDRAGELFAAHQQTIYRTTDRMFAVLMVVQWIAGIAAALWISPRTWIGTVSHTHLHVWAAIFLGGAISIFPIALAVKKPGATITRHSIATGQILMSCLLIYLTGGRIETHFHVFGSLAFLAFYRDWRVLVPATVVVAADHFFRGLFWPESVYGILAASQWRWLEHAGWVLFEDAVLFVAIKRSVAEMWDNARHTAELNNSEEKYRAVVEQTSEGLMLSDIETLRVIECNAAFARMLGYTVPEALMLTAYDFVVDDRDAIDARVAIYRREETGITGERRFRRKDGSVLDVEINMTVIAYGGKDVFCTIMRDISDRKQAEEALRQAHSELEVKVSERTAELEQQRMFLRQVLDLNPSFIFAKDRDGRFTLVNEALSEAYGTTVEGLLGKTDADFNSNAEQVDAFRRDDLEVIDGRTEKFIPEEIITDAAGNVRWLQTIKRPMLSPDGTVKHMLGVATDITQRKRAEHALRESEEMFRQAQKMDSIGTLAGGIAHDFNNLMTAVTGYSELVLRRMPGADPLRLKVEEIRKAGERAASLTRQLLAFSRKQMLKPVVLDLNTVITGMGKMLPRLIGEDIDLRFDLHVSLGQVEADPGQMGQVLMNLVVNARDAMPAGGCLTVKTENIEFTGRAAKRHIALESGSYVVLSVTDNGVGMDADTQSHIFEPFFTTKEVGKGTGLGLATVYGIVKQSGGSIWVYSELGKGTIFRIYLPRVDTIAAKEEHENAPQPVAKGDETILLVEDEDMVRNLAKDILEDYGYSVLIAANGGEGLRVCREFDGDIHLIITDVVMPQMSGPEMAESVQVLRPETSVLYMSGFTDDAVVRHGVLTEDMCFIQKPFSAESLAFKVREILDNNPGDNGSPAASPPRKHSSGRNDYGYHPAN
ncbi:MAG TPA: PAS domain S-box protein [Pyrinomonadaceae bacterium]|nr:PAS domain S-box protein [Pyrinomonadaceae bacterium]